MTDTFSVLLIHHRDIKSPFSATVPHYVSKELAESHTVHVLCKDEPTNGAISKTDSNVVFHDIGTTQIPVISGLLFLVLTSLYAVVLGARYRYDAVYGFQRTLIQAWLGSQAGGSRFVVGLQVVPVEQKLDFVDSKGGNRDIAEWLSVQMQLRYASLVEVLLQRSTEIVCLTEGIRRTTERAYGIDLSAAHVIGMGVDTETFNSASHSATEQFTEPLTVTYVGSIGPARGFAHVIDGLATSDGLFEFHVAGDGASDYIREMKSRADRLGVSDRIEWYGRIPHDDVPSVLADTDIALSPLEDRESYRVSFPAKLLEYMAAGAVVIATDIPPHQQLLTDGHDGVLYDGTETGLCNALRRCLDDPNIPLRMGARARDTAEGYDWENVVEEHAAVLFEGRDGTSKVR